MTDETYPAELKYTTEHEWLKAGGGEAGSARVGITWYAQDALGDVVYVSLPGVGDVVTAGDASGELESTKSVSEIFAPVSGTVVAVNEALDGSPELVNSDPYGDGWLFDVELADGEDASALLDSDAYQAVIQH